MNTSPVEFLNRLPGTYFIGTGQNPGSVKTGFIRGTNSYHTAYLLDGIPLMDPSSVNNSLDLNELTLNGLQSIELLKGSQSTLYGSSAIGGVVNLISDIPSPGSFFAHLNATGGLLNLSSPFMQYHVSLGKGFSRGFYFMAGLNQVSSKGIDLTTDTITSNNYHTSDLDAFNQMDYFLKAGYKNKKTDAFVSYRSYFHRAELDKRAFVDDDNRYLEFNRHLIYYSLKQNLSSRLKLLWKGGYSSMNRIDIDDSSVVGNQGEYDHQYAKSEFPGSYHYHELSVQYQSRIVKNITGLFYRQEKMNNKSYIYSYSPYFGVYEQNYNLDSLNLQSKTAGVFSQFTVHGSAISSSLSAFSLVFGGRILNHDRYGTQFTWDINPSYTIHENTLIYLAASSGFNSPSLYRLYAPDRAFGAIVSRGNQNLKPETSISFEWGIKKHWGNKFFLQTALFATRVSDIIEYVYLWDKNIGIDTLGNDWMRNDYRGDTYLNLSEQNISGLELSLEGVINPKLRARLNATLYHSEIKINPSDIDVVFTQGNHVQLFESGIFLTRPTSIQKLSRRPSGVVTISMNYKPLKNIETRLLFQWVGRRYDVYYNAALGPYGALDRNLLNAYKILDIEVDYMLLSQLHAGLAIRNLLNEKYAEIQGFNTLGRSVYLRIAYLFRQ